MSGLVLHASRFSRSFIAFWMLEELGVPYETEFHDLRERAHKLPGYLAINPMGKVPALVDGGVVITETPAICLHLADRYGYGRLAPKIEEPDRGAYLRWMVFSTAVFEPAAWLPDAEEPSGVGWGRKADMLTALEGALSPGPFILGDRFSAADVMLGGVVAIALFNKQIPETGLLTDYNARIQDRPACRRALALTGWA